ncbi:MAG: tetratricopeptide repeat protein [Sneathiella sp.]|nr:tetratricopeptide repeat protein [Sneathiella sp.]
MSDIFGEVDDEVRKDKSLVLWNKYGKFVIVGAVLLVAATAGTVGWKNYQLSQAQAQGKQFEEAVGFAAAKKFDEASTAFATLAEGGDVGYEALSRLRQAAALISAGNGAEALDVYDALAANENVGEEFSSIAGILAGYYLINNGSTEDVRKRVSGLAAAGGMWAASAKELLALSDLKDGKIADARTLLDELKQDASAPQGVKARAQQLLAALEAK